MRLTCPNCGAQYEVPAEVIPTDGRDVQCSNCGYTWFQAHPDAALTPAPSLEQGEPPLPGPEPEPDFEAEPVQEPEAAPEPEPQEELPDPAPVRQQMDSSVSDILREEAEREAELRAQEAQPEPMDIQTDLGLDNHGPDEAGKRARQAQERMAKIKGDPLPPPEDGESRRDLLPDIEEVSSTLKTSDDSQRNTQIEADDTQQMQKRSGGFRRGFVIALLIAALLVLAYMNAPLIAEKVPAAEATVNVYVATVDQARFWLESKVGIYLPR